MRSLEKEGKKEMKYITNFVDKLMLFVLNSDEHYLALGMNCVVMQHTL